MSNLTNWAENKMVDLYLRNQSWLLPASWYLGLASAADDASITEIAGSGYARQPVNRSLFAWAGTQGSGSTTASSGASHRTSNNASVSWGTAGDAWGDIYYVVLYDALSGGNAFAFAEIDPVLSVEASDPVSFGAGSIIFTLGVTGGMSDYLANKIIDEIFRGVPFSKPSALYARLLTSAPTNAGGGTEVAQSGYQRTSIVRSLTAWAGTQGATSTALSSGNSGITSNNADISWPLPGANWGTITHFALNDALVGGNMWFYGSMDTPKTVTASSPAPTILTSQCTITFA